MLLVLISPPIGPSVKGRNRRNQICNTGWAIWKAIRHRRLQRALLFCYTPLNSKICTKINKRVVQWANLNKSSDSTVKNNDRNNRKRTPAVCDKSRVQWRVNFSHSSIEHNFSNRNVLFYYNWFNSQHSSVLSSYLMIF